MLLAAIDWTPIIAAAVAGIPGVLAALVALGNRRAIQTPSGDKIGEVMERTHDLSAADVALTTAAVKILHDGKSSAEEKV